MSLRNNILLITDEQDFSSKLYEKLVLLREKDSLYTLSYEEASKQARIKFAKSYKVFGDDVKIGLQQIDLVNHIDEILTKLYKGGKENG